MSDAPPGVILAGEGQEKKLVRDIMTKNVVVVYPDTSLDEAFRQMSVKGVGRLPVVEEEGSRKLVGIISDRHIRLAADSPFLGHRPEQIILNLGKHKVCETMKTAAITIEDTSPIIDAVKEVCILSEFLPHIDWTFRCAYQMSEDCL